MTDDVLTLMRARHSARVPFDRARPVPRAALTKILEAARWAPTAHNMQNFDIVVVDAPALVDALGAIPAELSETFIRENFAQLSFSEEELRARKVGILGTMFPPSWRTSEPDMKAIAAERECASLHDTIQDSPTLLVVVYDPRKRAPASEGDFLGVISLGCMMENMWLVAESLGLGFQVMSVFSGATVAARVKETLGIPPALAIAFAVRLGYPTKSAYPVRVRRDLGDFVHHDRFGRRGLDG